MRNHPAVLMALAGMLWCCAASAMAADPKPFFDHAKAAAKDAAITPTRADGVQTIKVVAKAKADGWSGAELPAAGGKADLSAYRFVVAEVRNLSPAPAVLYMVFPISRAA